MRLQPFYKSLALSGFSSPSQSWSGLSTVPGWGAPLGLRAPIWEFAGLGKAGAKFLSPWNKIEAPAVICYFIGQVKFLFQILCLFTSLFQLDCVTSFSLKK